MHSFKFFNHSESPNLNLPKQFDAHLSRCLFHTSVRVKVRVRLRLGLGSGEVSSEASTVSPVRYLDRLMRVGCMSHMPLYKLACYIHG